MLYVVTGGSGSGKSALAEAKIRQTNKTRTGKRYYIATMLAADDAETKTRIAKHQRQRKEDDYITIECPYKLSQISHERDDSYLLECMSNLLANEMFMQEGDIGHDKDFDSMRSLCRRTILQPIYELARDNTVVVVTNEVFSDGTAYSACTKQYMELLAYINRELAAKADAFAEAVCGIPVLIKGEW